MPADGGSIPAPDRAVPLASVPGDVDHDRRAEVAWICAGRASTQPMHAASGEVKGRPDADDRAQHMRQRRGAVVAVMEVPALIVVISESRVGRSRRHVLVEDARPVVGVCGVHDREPVLDDPSYPVVPRVPGGTPRSSRSSASG